MAFYRIDFVGGVGDVRGERFIAATDDLEAVWKARLIVDGRDVDLWDGKSLVGRVPWRS